MMTAMDWKTWKETTRRGLECCGAHSSRLVTWKTHLHYSLIPDRPLCRVWECSSRLLSRQHRACYIIHDHQWHSGPSSADSAAEKCCCGCCSERTIAQSGHWRQAAWTVPPPLRRALDHPSNLLHECTQSATHQRATADMGQTGGIRWDYRPRCPLLFWCPSLANSPLPFVPFSTPHSPVQLWHHYREAMHWEAESRKPPLRSPLSQPHANTLSHKWNLYRQGT